MFQYIYKIITPERVVREGEMRSWSSLLVRRKLEREQNIVIYVNRKKGKILGQFSQSTIVSMSNIQRILFFRNMAMMLDSGINLSSALHSMVGQVQGIGTKRVFQNIYSEVSNGTKLSVALAKYPTLFPKYIVKTIEVGEQSGTLVHTLDRISLDLERAYELRRKVISAILYPIIILFFMLAAAVLLVVMVLPQIASLFAELDEPLPVTTRVLQDVGIFITTYTLQILLVLTTIVFSFIISLRIRRFRLIVHATVLRVPVFGPLLREYTLSVFTRALGTLLSSGITFVQALESVKGTLRNESYIQVVEKIHPVVIQGGSFSDALRSAPFHFPEQFRNLVEVGENTGKLRPAFEKASDHYERSVLFQTQILTTVIEPMLMIVAGVLVGFLAFSIFGPLYGIAVHM